MENSNDIIENKIGADYENIKAFNERFTQF